MSFTDDQIRSAVMLLLKKYDGDNTGYVEGNEKARLLHDLQL